MAVAAARFKIHPIWHHFRVISRSITWTLTFITVRRASGFSFPGNHCEMVLGEQELVDATSPYRLSTASHHACKKAFIGLRGFTMEPRLVSNSWASCLSLASAGITGVHHHTWRLKCFSLESRFAFNPWEAQRWSSTPIISPVWSKPTFYIHETL